MLLLALACASDPAVPVGLSGVEVEVDADIATMLNVRWSQDDDAASWIEWTTVDGAAASPPVERGAGAADEVALGIPADTEVELRVVAERDGLRSTSDPVLTRTGPLPEAIVPPVVTTWEPAAATGEGWLLGSVDVDGGDPYSGPCWLFIVDRAGHVVWYRDVSPMMSMFPRVARDGTHLAYDVHSYFHSAPADDVVRRTSLDGTRSADVPTPWLGWAWDETLDGTVLYDRIEGERLVTLESVGPDGEATTVWDCATWLATWDADWEHCYTNTVNWSPTRESVLWSTYWGDWIAEIDLGSGAPRWHAGALPEGWRIDPVEAALDLQHYPNFTPEGTLLVSTHIPGKEGEQRARELRLDDSQSTLTQVWSYGEGAEGWARYSGEAVRLANGNTLLNYGTGGEVREIGADGAIVWSLRWGDTRTLGHTQLVGDLYALNRGP